MYTVLCSPKNKDKNLSPGIVVLEEHQVGFYVSPYQSRIKSLFPPNTLPIQQLTEALLLVPSLSV